jgi:lyso-ornithine lipid O-acyltransferase
MIRVLRTIRFIIVMVAYCADMVWRGRKRSPADRMAFIAHQQKVGCQRLTRGLRISSEVIGDFPKDQPTLIVANHIGTMDPWILASHFEVAFVAKAEMGTWPLLGWVCRAVGIIFAHRRNVMKTAQTVEEIETRMRSGVAVLIFPEGTTSDGSELLPFKTGGFESVTNMDDGFIVPMYFHVRDIKNTKAGLDERKLVTWSAPQSMVSNLWQVLGLGPLHFVIRIGSPIPVHGKNRKELARASQEAVENLKRQEEAELARASSGTV